MRKLLYIDSSYTLSQIRARGLDHVLRIRFLNGYFDQVWSAHPVDTHPAADPGLDPAGKPVFERLSNDHVFVRGRYGRFPALARIASLNALLALGSFVCTLVRLVRREKITVIRAGDPLLCGLIGLIVSRLTGARLVVRINGDHDMLRANTGSPIMPSLFRTGAIENRIERAVLKRADSVLAPSRNYGEFAVSKGTDPSRVVIVRYGNLIDTRHLSEPADREPPSDPALAAKLRERPWMLFVGRLIEPKYVSDCIEVLARVAALGSDAGLCLAGDGPLRSKLTSRAEALGVADRILFLGNISQDELSRLVPKCELVLSPINGRSLSEAAFGAVPMVAYDLDWQGELVVDGLTGILLKPRDIESMAQGAFKLLSDRKLARSYGAAARTRAFKLLAPQDQTKIEISVYCNLENKRDGI